MDEQEQVVGSTELAITVEMGDDFVPGARTSAALAELATALQEEHADDVSGFGADQSHVRSFAFTTMPKPGQQTFEAWPAKWKMSSPTESNVKYGDVT